MSFTISNDKYSFEMFPSKLKTRSSIEFRENFDVPTFSLFPPAKFKLGPHKATLY